MQLDVKCNGCGQPVILYSFGLEEVVNEDEADDNDKFSLFWGDVRDFEGSGQVSTAGR